MSSVVKNLIINVIGLHLGTVINENSYDEIIDGMVHLEEFISNKNILYAFSQEETKNIRLTSSCPSCVHEKCIIFIKRNSSLSETEDFLRHLQIYTLSSSPATDMYEFTNNIINFMQSEDYKDVREEINTLQSALKPIVFTENEGNHIVHDNINLLLDGSNSLRDEIIFWKNFRSTEFTKAAVDIFVELLSQMDNDLSIIESMSNNEVEELLDRCHNTLDDLWRSLFPEERMINLMNFIGDCIWKYVAKKLLSCNVWSEEYFITSGSLREKIVIGEKWLTTCKLLTGIFWPNYSSNPWTGEIHQPSKLVQRISLLKNILNIRTIHRQFIRLSSPFEQADLQENIFKSFQDIDMLNDIGSNASEILKAQKEFEDLLEPAEERVATIIKKQMKDISANTTQLIYEFTRYTDIMSRPVVKRILSPERSFLLNSINKYMVQIENQPFMEALEMQHEEDSLGSIQAIIVARQLETKLNTILYMVNKLLDDMDGFESTRDLVNNVRNNIKIRHTELFELWCSYITADINNKKVSLREDDPIIQFHDKLLKVNYPSRLIILISEVRQLKGMGYHIPSLIETTIQKAKKCLGFARTLEQIANFHNTIGDRIIPSQKPMLLSSALELSKLVQEEEAVPWTEEKSIEKYVSLLRQTVEKLSQSNSFLTTCHIEIINKIQELKNENIFKEMTKWNEIMKSIKNILANVENKGYKNLQLWKAEIDDKLEELLEKEYRKNIESMQFSIEDIRIDLVYRNSAICINPNKKALEQIYDERMKKYIELPKLFKGVSNQKDYHQIIERNQDIVQNALKEKEKLFSQIESLIIQWQSWIRLEELVTSNLLSAKHWDLYFRASKSFGQELAKLSCSEEKIGCFSINSSKLKSDLETHNRTYWDQLVFSLENSISEDITKLQNYINPSIAALTKQPFTLVEIEASEYTNILPTHSKMQELFDEILYKSQILSNWTKKKVESLEMLRKSWEELSSLILNYKNNMAKQIENYKTSLNVEKENILRDIDRFKSKWCETTTTQDTPQANVNIQKVYSYFESIKSKRDEWNTIIERKEELLMKYEKFDMDKPDFSQVERMSIIISEEESLWKVFEEFNSAFVQICSECWMSHKNKLHYLEDLFRTWEQRLMSHEEMPFIPVVLKYLEQLQEAMAVLHYLKGEHFSENHWKEIFDILGIKSRPVEEIHLGDFLENHESLLSHKKYIQDLNIKATAEIAIRQTLDDIHQWSLTSDFSLNIYNDRSGRHTIIIKDFKDSLKMVEDFQIILQSFKNSDNYNNFFDIINSWQNKLSNLNHYLNSLAQIQKRWLYLEEIFKSGILPQEKEKFDRLDNNFRKIMLYIEHHQKIIGIIEYPNIKSDLQTILDQLSRCQQSLNNFLKEKRDIFPRFLFLSDEDLLEIIGHSSRESVAQSKFKKLFTGIDSVQLSTNNDKILAVCSSEGESVPLLNPVDIKKPIEEWLSDLSKATQNTLRDLLFKCQHEKLAPDPLKYPAQILCLSNHIDFTMKCEQAITGLSLPVLLAKYKAQLNELFCLDLKNDIEIDRKNDSVLELKYKALFLDNIHHTRILEELLNENVTHLSNWVWLKQLRFYIGSNGDVIIKMGKAELNYAYEYLGNLPKLVRTPLIERCFLTLTQAMHLGLGGNLYGPAGTGKTESVKTLGSVLGRHVIVFNCDESIDADSLERMLTGIVKIGAWGCFDEFNRLGETTLSAVSMMIKSIQEALKNNLSTVKLLNQTVPVNKFCGVFVTLNPAGGSYGGRKKLPDNLKQLFRPVVMKLPYNKEIVRTCLTCDGYQHAEKIAQKIVEVFEMSSKIMSKKQHYDWGLRAIKSVVSSCQMRLKKYKMSQKVENNLSLNEELSIASSVLREEIISKLTSRDCIKFDDLLNIVFKEIEVDIKRDENEYIKKAVLESIKDFNLVVNERQVSKCLEFHNHINQRIGVAIIGPPSSGKSTIIKIVSKALNKINKRVNVYNVNPKSMTRQHLLGYTDYLNQWNNGVLINYALQAAEESEDVWSWIVCDGDMDPDWIESLNSALDDNKLLTLPSGCRINFNSNVNFIFETHDVQNASPATISRLGVVYLDSEDLPLPVYSRNLLNCLEESQRMFLEPLVNKFLLSGIKWISSNGKTSVYRSDISIARTSFVHIKEVGTELHFLVNLIHGLGQQLRQNRREKFAKQIFKWAQEDMPTFNVEESYYDPEKNIIADYKAHLDIEEANIENGIPLIKIGKVLKYIHTIQTYLVSGNEEHFLLCGPHGAAKRLMVNYIARTRSEFKTVIIPCCPNFTTEFVIYQIQQHCISVSTLHGNLLRPRIGHILLYFRNIHLLKMDVWGSNILIEFLRQLVEYNGFYDQKAEFVRVQNITVIGTMLPTNQISPRFLSKLHLINIDLPEMEDLSTITMTYLSRIVKTHFPALNCSKMQIKKLAYTMITVFEKAVEFFKAIHLNYVQLSPHDLTQWCTNIKNYSISMEEIELIEVVYFEARKIFTDRVMKQESKIEMDILIDNVFKANWGDNSLMNKELNSYFVFDQSIIKEKQMLKKFSKDDWQLEVKRGLTEYGNDDRKLNIVITSEILLLISTIMRVTALSEHNLVLIGKGGIGRKTSIKIASALSSSQIFHPHSGEYPLFNHELILAIQCAGVQCQNVFLILEDNIFLNDQNLASVNLLLATSDIGHLFKSIEMESIIKGLKEKYDTEDIEELFIILVNNIKNNLHVFVCLDQDNSNLRNIFLKCPALLHNCYGIWLDTWSEDTIKLFPIKLGELLGEDETVRNNSNFELIYKSLPNFIPLKYIYMIKLYYVICDEKKTSILSKMLKLQGGVSKLSSAKKLVVELRKKAESQQDQLADKQSKANVALEMISKTIEGANTQKEEMEILRKKTQEENVELVARKTEIEKELAEVEPLIRKASAAVGTIKSESLSEIRSLRAPPEIIRDILEGVLKLMGIQDTSWNSMKIFLAKRGVKEEIRSFDASCITQENLNAVENLLKTKRESYEISNAKRASVAAAPLATWVDANVKYSRVLSKIKPLEQEQQKLQRNLENAESQLAQLNVNLLDVKSSVTKLKDQLSLYTKEAAEIEVELKEVSQTLTAAETLVSKLQDEYERWQIQLEELSEELDSSSHNCLLAAAYMVFLSETTESLRRSLIQKWCTESRIKKDFMFKDFFYSENDKLNWELEGLPTNRTAIENAIIIKKGILTPLLIDPTSTILKWLRNHFRQTGQHFEYINYKALKFNTILEASMRFGKILLVEEIDDAFHALLPLLREEFIYEGERRLIDLLGKKVDCNIKFKLVMCSKNEQLSIPAAVAPFLNVLRFDITHSEFTEQLLSAAILQEKPELDLKRKELLQQQEELQKQLEILRDRLLECLASSDDNILENKNLLNTLNETKTNSVAVWKAIEESKNIQLKLREDYEIFLDISSFASKLYIACREFTKYNRLYSWSTQYYKKLFLQCLNSFQVYQENSMNEKVIQFVYENMSQGVFKSDKIAFLLHLVYKMFPSQIPENEINVFLGKAEYTESENSKEDTSDLPTWLPTYCKSKIQFIKKCLPDLFNKCQFIDKSNWVTFLNSSTCEKEFPLFCKLTEFQKLLIIQSLRPDKLLTAMSNCVSHITGLKTIELPILNLHKTFKESTALEPILLITTAGMEPSDDIRNLAKQINIEYEEVSLAESQQTNALVFLQECKTGGKWLILKNIHLVLNWIPILFERLTGSFDDINSDFRLWLISESVHNLDPVFIQNCIKIVYEEPDCLAHNIQKNYASFSEKFDKKIISATSARIFFAFTFLHALLQGRRKYIPQGWTKYYEFNHTDLLTCLILMEDNWNTNTTRVQWEVIKGITCEAVYGGRIEDEEDLKILETYSNIYFNENILSQKWNPLDLNFNLPMVKDNKEYMKIIKTFPKQDHPHLFGLPANIEKTREKQISSKLILNLKGFYINQRIEDGYKLQNLQIYFKMWKELNQDRDYTGISISKEFSGKSSIERFIHEEYYFGIILIQRIHKCLTILNKISKGILEDDEDYIVMAKFILQYQTPPQWLSTWRGPEDPSQYLQQVIRNMNYVSTWRENMEILLRQPIKLSLFFEPQAFLASSRQDYARTAIYPLENIVLRISEDNSDNGILLSDLYVEGALYANKTLSQCTPESDSINIIPTCYLCWCNKEEYVSNEVIEVPLYSDSSRDFKIINLEILSEVKEKQKWILSGLSFYLRP